MSTFEIGSRTARGGFDLEKLVVDKFNNWQNDNDADRWLSVMGVEIFLDFSWDSLYFVRKRLN